MRSRADLVLAQPRTKTSHFFIPILRVHRAGQVSIFVRITASFVCLLTRHRLIASPVFICLTRQASLCLIKQTFKPSKIYYSSSQHGSSARTNGVGASLGPGKGSLVLTLFDNDMALKI